MFSNFVGYHFYGLNTLHGSHEFFDVVAVFHTVQEDPEAVTANAVARQTAGTKVKYIIRHGPIPKSA